MVFNLKCPMQDGCQDSRTVDPFYRTFPCSELNFPKFRSNLISIREISRTPQTSIHILLRQISILRYRWSKCSLKNLSSYLWRWSCLYSIFFLPKRFFSSFDLFPARDRLSYRFTRCKKRRKNQMITFKYVIINFSTTFLLWTRC